MKRILMVLFAGSCLVFAQEAASQAQDAASQKILVTHTERADFPAGGLLQFNNSIGELSVEGWDRPDVEITTIKSTKDVYPAGDREKMIAELDKVKISLEHQGEGLTITTDVPRHHAGPAVRFDVEYRIKAPMNARLTVDHGAGEVHVDNLTSDVHVTVRNGEITLHLPQENQYGIDAKSKLGAVISDFPGHEKRLRWRFGQTFIQETKGAHVLYLRVGFGDIVILKYRKPVAPGPVTQ
jgi:hypothetical protein